MSEQDERNAAAFFTYLHISRRLRGWRPPPPKYPSMPKAQWRSLAAICVAIGAVIGAVAVGGDGGRVIAAAVVGGLLGLVIGMWTIETLWLRRRNAARPPGPS